MRGMRRFLWVVIPMTLALGMVWAAEPFKGFNTASSRGIRLPDTYNGFHFEDKTDSSIGWMHLLQLKDGGFLVMLFTVANLGPYHLAPSFGAMYMHPDGRNWACNGLWNDSDYFTSPPKDRYQIRVNKSTFGGRYPDFYIKMAEEDCSADIRFKSILTSYRQGTGRATFGADGAGMWELTAISPRAQSSGFIKFKQGTVDVAGDAYLETVATDMLVPTMSDRWVILHSYSGPYTLHLFDIQVDKKNYGEGHIRTLMLARGDQILMGTTRFTLTTQATWKDSATDILVPSEFGLSARDGEAHLAGKVKLGRVLNSMNLLSKLPTMARLFAGVMYGTPFQYRTVAEYDLVLTEGEAESRLKGTGFTELHYYDR